MFLECSYKLYIGLTYIITPATGRNNHVCPPFSTGNIEAETKVTTELSTELYGLQKYANYSVTMWAFTQVGDGIKSRPFYCMTDEDGKSLSKVQMFYSFKGRILLKTN